MRYFSFQDAAILVRLLFSANGTSRAFLLFDIIMPHYTRYVTILHCNTFTWCRYRLILLCKTFHLISCNATGYQIFLAGLPLPLISFLISSQWRMPTYIIAVLSTRTDAIIIELGNSLTDGWPAAVRHLLTLTASFMAFSQGLHLFGLKGSPRWNNMCEFLLIYDMLAYWKRRLMH